ncbi:hypothetical protein DS2_02870 [Catenovulum agarivorans DS-2]|uniref:Cardiolipin synthase N-terminal domain-containing protein n=1 Tax=Catenovulum agarivorans DS-2 TaxID=1328313 RepID=W7QIQ0_9ALTE|nr:hypothetical protein [Catenovulum agarivorans]EWH11731.1 hypothetical protein DS2_02870 [Catenovulum agarivorans DS-2]
MGLTETDLLLYIIGICFFLLPIALVAGDKRAMGQSKNMWLLATLFLSWLGWLVYISTVQAEEEKKKEQQRRADKKAAEEGKRRAAKLKQQATAKANKK